LPRKLEVLPGQRGGPELGRGLVDLVGRLQRRGDESVQGAEEQRGHPDEHHVLHRADGPRRALRAGRAAPLRRRHGRHAGCTRLSITRTWTAVTTSRITNMITEIVAALPASNASKPSS